MKEFYKFFIIYIVLINCLFYSRESNLKNEILTDDIIHNINEDFNDRTDYKRAQFEASSTDVNHFFKHDISVMPSSLVSAFRIEFDQFGDTAAEKYKIYCTSVSSSTTDANLISALKQLTSETSSCVGGFNSFIGYYDGIIKLDESKPKVGIYLISNAGLSYKGSVYFRTEERILQTDEEKPMDEESYSAIPYTINIPKFRELSKSKILFYSYTRELQMYYVQTNSPHPEKLFSGNIMSVFTNPNMVRQKYHGANLMVLITNKFGGDEIFGEPFKYEVKLFDSDFLLDYYVSSVEDGRPLYSPLLINMTECTNPYYVILNYNQVEGSKTLILDQIYGKMSYLSVASQFTQTTWDKMIEKDMVEVDLKTRKYILPSNSRPHMDVYKIECEMPLMFNFYFIEESDYILTPKMNYGDINIFTLKPYETVNIPFFLDMTFPQIIIEIFNPVDDPIIIVEAQEENVYLKNSLIKITPMTLADGITIKERGGLSDTRIIIKVGYSNLDWEEIAGSDYMKYNKEYDMYLFEFPNDEKRYNYTVAELITSGTNSEDNVKYCFTPNIGAALKPSSENCYRVSKDNSYTLKAYNPLIMYKDYEYDEGLSYFITFKAVTEATSFNVEAKISEYDTKIRNYEGINNKITIDSTGDYSSILTPPKNKDSSIFIQVQVCDNTHSVNAKIIKPLTGDIVVEEYTIPAGTKNSYKTFMNEFIDTEFFVTGQQGVNVFIRMVGLPTIYSPSFNNNQQITFDSTTNTITIDSSVTTTEYMKYTVLVDKEGEITRKGFTLCSFVDVNIEKLTIYTKSIVSNNRITSIQLNFNKAGISPGDKFEAIVYIEQQAKGQMVFLSNIYEGTVGDIDIETIHEINEVYTQDTDYIYKTIEAKTSDPSFYFSFQPSEVFNVSIGSFGIELDSSATGSFTGVACTFVDNDTDAMSMIESIESTIEESTSYCIGSQSSVNSKRYNYIFKYEYEDEYTPKKMVIKLTTGNNVNGKFNIYMKKDQGVIVENTDYESLKEYGKDEDSKKSPIPYIVDVYTLRGNNKTDYVSKVLFYSQHLEMQMYYVPTDSNAPIKLFSGNIALVYTKPDLAIQKYHATTLVLISENLEGQEHASLGNSFRFHTKMFKSDAQIEFFVSQNPDGRTLNFPLSLEMNTCTNTNNKLYYLVNYNKPEQTRTLHLDMIFGSFLTARIAREINAEKWDLLISNSMTDISNYQIELPQKSQHIDIIEITCKSPLLLNAYYSYDGYSYNSVKEGEIVVKELTEYNSFSFSVEKGSSPLFFYSMSLFNPTETPDVTVRFSDGIEHYISENSIQTGMHYSTPERVSVINNKKSKTRFIFKIGFGVETSEGWHEVEEEQYLDGTLFANKNKYVYKFPVEDNKKNFTKVRFLVNSVNDAENVKFCYSTNIGTAIEASRENCFRTGKYIPYNLTFINPFIVGKNYKVDTDKYYISFMPFNDEDYINIEVFEEKYETLNRNEEGVPKLLTLINGKASSILSLPEKETSRIFVQLTSCKSHSSPIQFRDYNALSHEEIKNGKIYETDRTGITFYTENTYIENEIELTGEAGVTIFSKHTTMGNYNLNITDYKVSFDSTANAILITKPVNDETFNITVIVGLKGTLNYISQCDLAFKDKSTFGDYSYTFTSVSSNIITHYVDFALLGYNEGTEFDILVYAEQLYNTKMDFLYPIVSGVVGKISGVLGITEYIDNYRYVTKTFQYKSSSNYLYYDFAKIPTGKIASLKIITNKAKVNKVGCVFSSKYATDSTMVSDVNKAVLEGKSVCLGEMQKDNDGYDALINANFQDVKSRLVIQVLYGLGEEIKEGEEEDIVINIKVSGTELGESEGKFGDKEDLAPIPYVIDLLKIRERKMDQMEYVSKVLFYSNSREMEMFYIDEETSQPVSLFTGNIMLVYTNEELINQKYHGATTMILITDALAATDRVIIGEQYRFMVKFFNSAANIQYFLSSNSDGRVLNNPTAIEMTSCAQPYYYIMNYNQIEEGKRVLHIDTIFGEKQSIKLATSLNYNNWDDLISDMKPINGDQTILEETNFHFDIIEVKCNLPLLLNLYYVDPENPKLTNVEKGDIIIISLEIGQSKVFYFKAEDDGPFVYSFNVFKDNALKPNIEIRFDEETILTANENGIFKKDNVFGYEKLEIINNDKSGSTSTRVIFKFGYVIESKFLKIENGIYSNHNNDQRTVNLFGYKYDTTSTRLNYTGVDFQVKTSEDNVKFCYSTNLGSFINPSLQNCYRVGKNNPYTISTLNPLVMYKDYVDNDITNYYVGFRTVELNQNITIVPIERKYDTTERNLEGAKNKITIRENKNYSTILTAPKNNEPFIFTQIQVCTKDKALEYEFLNAYNHSNLGYKGEISPNRDYYYLSVNNTKLDTELKLYADNGVDVFVKHIGLAERYQATVKEIEIQYNKDTYVLNWTQPIDNEEFLYTVYIDKIDTLKDKGYTLCTLTEITKLGHYSQTLNTNDNNPHITLDFNKPELGKDYKDFDVIILAEQVNFGKLTLLSTVYDSNGNKKENKPSNNKSSNIGLIVVICILSGIIIAGGIFAFIIYRKYKGKGAVNIKNKETSMALIKSTKNDKLVESQAQENNEIDP